MTRPNSDRDQRRTCITIREAATQSGISEDQVAAAARRAAFRSWIAGGRRMVHIDSFNEWVAQRRDKDNQYGAPAQKARQ